MTEPKRAQLKPEDEELIRKKAFGHLATLMPNGNLQTTPVWVDVQDGLILVNTAESRVKTRNVRRDPRVAISIQDPDDPYKVLALRGRVVEVAHEGAEEHIDQMATKYLGVDVYPYHDPEDPRVLLKIDPEHIVRSGYGPGDLAA